MKHKITSILFILALVLGMGTAAAADESGYNGDGYTSGGVSTEQTTTENTNKVSKLVIDQQQFQRTISSGTVILKAYEDNEHLVAGVYESEEAFDQYESVSIQNKAYEFWRGIDNSTDDIVVVSNVEGESNTSAYVRTVFAFPVFSDGETHLYLNFHKPSGADSMEGILEEVNGIAEIGGQDYQLYVYNYSEPLAPGQTSEPSLLEYVFDKDVTTEMFDEFPQGTYKILITSQAVQESGFTSVKKAFTGTFAKVTAANHPWINKD